MVFSLATFSMRSTPAESTLAESTWCGIGKRHKVVGKLQRADIPDGQVYRVSDLPNARTREPS
jgi:hypothetical protein